MATQRNANFFLISICNTIITCVDKKLDLAETRTWLAYQKSDKGREDHPDIVRIGEFFDAAFATTTAAELKAWAKAEKKRIQNEGPRVIKTWEEYCAEEEAKNQK